MAKQDKQRARQKGRSKASHLGIPHYIVRSPEFGSLPPWPLKLLIELAGGYNGFNNGNLSAAFSALRERGWNSPGTLSAALKYLQQTRWITRTRTGNKNRCALYAVTWWPIDECPGKHLEVGQEQSARHSWKTEVVVGTCSNVVGTCSSQPHEAR